MEEKPRVLVVYGYHPKEWYAFQVGLALAKDPDREFLVERYVGKGDARSRVEYEKNLEKNLHDFIESFGARYAIVLHDSGKSDFRRKTPAGYVHLKSKVQLEYESRRKVPLTLQQKLKQILSEHFSNEGELWMQDGLSILPRYQYHNIPVGLDELSIEFYHYKQIKKRKAVAFAKDLAQLLLRESDE